MEFNQDAAQWVYDVVSKMDDDEAALFATLVAHDMWHTDMEGNRRSLEGISKAYDEMVTQDVAQMLLDHLEAGGDPAEALAIAASVSIAKSNDTWKYQERNHGMFGRLTGAQYRAQKRTIKVNTKADRDATIARLKYERKAGLVDDVDSLRRAPARARQFEQDFNVRRPGDESGATSTFRRVEAGGKLVQDLGTATNRPGLYAAGALANYSGQFGPEAEKVVGPSMRRAAYRYRGTERTPDKELGLLTEIQARQVLHEQGKEMGTTKQTVTTPSGVKRTVEVPNKNAMTALSPEERAHAAESAALSYFVGGYKDGKQIVPSRLPSSALAELQRKSGKISPSEGIIIDANGKVAHQAVGYGEDHYLPFNLKNLTALKGGSYVRTRESGGLTTEDIYTGLMTGARSMSVVSNSGVFTIDFADDLRGGRRYNDKARQMVDRYGKTLDAVKSQQVTNPKRALSAREKAEFRINAEEKIESDPALKYATDEQKKQWVDAELQRAMTSPQLSAEQESEIARRAKSGTDDPREQKIHYRELRDEAMDKMNTRNYQLDGEGYSVALDALKEQFPYFIADVRYQTKSGAKGNDRSDFSRIFNGGTDQGYVKPRYNRPEAAQSGYFDSSITGQGKVNADRTNYQNLRGRRQEQARGETAPTEAAAPKQADTPEDFKARMQEGDKGKAEAKKMNDALSADVDAWGSLHKSERDARREGLDQGDYGTMLEFHGADDTARIQMLADPKTRARLIAETEKASREYGERLGGKAPRNMARIKEQSKRTQMSPEALASDTAPVVPLAINAKDAEAEMQDPDFRQLMGLEDGELMNLSQQSRTERAKLAAAGNTGDKHAYHSDMIKRVEFARAAKAQKPPEVDEDLYDTLAAAGAQGTVKALPKVGPTDVHGGGTTDIRERIKRIAALRSNPDFTDEKYFATIDSMLDRSDLDDEEKRQIYREATGNIRR